MYCPNCGADNQAEIRFCTRCGTNLEVVQDALTGKPSSSSKFDQKMVRLLKNYYRGRRGMMIGAPMALAGIIVQGIIFALGFPERLIPFMVLSLIPLVYGFISTFVGIARWNSAASELKAIGTVSPQANLPRATPALTDEARTVGAYSTEPILGPASVTEQTTRHLDAQKRIEPPEHQ